MHKEVTATHVLYKEVLKLAHRLQMVLVNISQFLTTCLVVRGLVQVAVLNYRGNN